MTTRRLYTEPAAGAFTINATVGSYTWTGVPVPIAINVSVGQYTWIGNSASVGAVITINCLIGTYTWAGISATTGLITIQAQVGAFTWAGIAAVIPASLQVLLLSPFFQADLVPGPVTVLLRHWVSGSWVDDGSALTVTQLSDPHIPNSYVVNANYTPNSDGSYQAVPIWNSAAVAQWQATHAYAANALVQPVTANGHYFKVIAGGGGNSGGSEPSWPLTGGTVVDGALTWQDQGQCLFFGDPIYIAPTAGSATTFLSALKADTDWKTILANANGCYTYTPPASLPGNGTLVLKDKANVTTLATLTLTFDVNGNPTIRTST